ncbi:MAG: tRNA (cytidine(34)-2'-O)-methyltransferase [Alphaproteobacteria bacterium]|nr:MAG: tRNA (cytidine(34)-2'-O)-methyltransferase [Alphaproteobacteria bacterium]
MRLALYQPDIAQNVGTMLRLAACMEISVDIIEPCGFPFGGQDLKRAVMDYAAHADVIRYMSFEKFVKNRSKGRLVLMTTKAATPYTGFSFRESDILLMGRESAGVPDDVHQAADHRLLIPMATGMRSINVAMAAAMVLGEALRQTGTFPALQPTETALND